MGNHKPRLSKTKSWAELDGADRPGLVTPCRVPGQLKKYQDLPDDLVYTAEQLDALCRDEDGNDCPLLELCRTYGKADRGATGVWGRVQYMNDRLEAGSRKKEVPCEGA